MRTTLWGILIALSLSACNQSVDQPPTEQQDISTINAETDLTELTEEVADNMTTEEDVDTESWFEGVNEYINQSDEPPVEFHLSEEYDIGGNPFLQLNMTAIVDQVEIYDVTINRGNTCAPKFWHRQWAGHGTLKFGHVRTAFMGCNVNAIKEVSVSTDVGEFVFNF